MTSQEGNPTCRSHCGYLICYKTITDFNLRLAIHSPQRESSFRFNAAICPNNSRLQFEKGCNGVPKKMRRKTTHKKKKIGFGEQPTSLFRPLSISVIGKSCTQMSMVSFRDGDASFTRSVGWIAKRASRLLHVFVFFLFTV